MAYSASSPGFKNKGEFRNAVKLRYDSLASGRYPLHMRLWGNPYGWSLYDLQIRRFYLLNATTS